MSENQSGVRRIGAAARAAARALGVDGWRAPSLFLALAGIVMFALVFAAPHELTIDTVLLLFPPWVAAAAWLGGGRLGLIATALGLIAGWALGPAHGFVDLRSGGLFAALGAILSAGGEVALKMRRQREAAARVLEQREAHLRSIFDSAPEAMVVINTRGIVQSYGASAERMFGWRPGAVIGRNVSMLMPQPFRGQHDSYLKRYLATGEKRIIGAGRIVVGERKDGSTFPMELTVAEVASDHGRFFTGFVRDLTESQESEARLQELQAEVVHISRLSAMGEMASALAHEINQPLSAISNYLNGARLLLAREGRGGQPAAEAIEKAADQALRAGDIIRRLRDFLARGEGERRVESLGKLVHEACALALVGAGERGVTVRYMIDAHRDRVLVDRIQVQQVIVNLVRNALDAMQDQERRILEIATRVKGDMAEVSVADTGPGLDPAACERLFQPFVTTKPQGMGVGLSISRTIIEAHGGRIWTEPNPGGGAVFRFSVRMAVEEEVAGDG